MDYQQDQRLITKPDYTQLPQQKSNHYMATAADLSKKLDLRPIYCLIQQCRIFLEWYTA